MRTLPSAGRVLIFVVELDFVMSRISSGGEGGARCCG